MPLRLYDNNDWRSPTNIRIYNNGWQDAKVGYVYNLGLWKVVFPDPIIPLVNVIDNGSWAQVNTVDVFYVQMILNTSELESMVGELYSGTSATGTPLQTQTFNYEYILEGYEYYIRFYVSSPGTYTIKATATSITQNSVSVVSQPISPILLSVNITSASLTRDLYSVSWTSVGQEEYTVSIEEVGPGITGETVDSGSSTTARSSSGGIFTRLLGNTQYDIFVGIRRSGEFLYTYASIRLTTPAGYAPAITNFSATSTCNSITATWTNNSDVDSIVINIAEAQGFEQSMPYFGLGQNFNLAAPQNSKTFLNLNPYGYLNSPTAGIYQISIYGESVDGTETGIQYLNINTLPQSVNRPTNFTATSDYWGKNASFTWTAATANCTTVSGYRLEYKLSTSSTWTNLSNSIASNAVSFSVGSEFDSIFAPGRTYNFRLYAKSSVGEGPPASVNLTMNNNPHNIAMSGINSIETSSSSVLTAQLRNADYENLSRSGVTISWSFTAGINPPSESSISPTSSNTNSSGQATSTFSSGNDDGTGTVFTTTSGLGAFGTGQRVMTVNLRAALTPSLFWSPSAFGGTVTNSQYNSSYSYTGSISSGGSLQAGQSYGSVSFTVSIPVQDGVSAPTMSGDNTNGVGFAGTVTCTISNVWVVNPTVSTISVTSSRLGYNSGTGSLSNVQPNRSRTTILYELINTANGNVMYSVNTNNNTVSYQYPGVDVGKVVRWRCTATFSDNSTSTRSSGTRTLG